MYLLMYVYTHTHTHYIVLFFNEPLGDAVTCFCAPGLPLSVRTADLLNGRIEATNRHVLVSFDSGFRYESFLSGG